ncbi:tripartite motif-containing protein 16-like, partial [Limanda limanda]|uniref:tripartite motif-containing protein 16-like n=1 Tax=Limanda limanda TaxID=27771 RepID=UPI0029C6001A
EDLLKDPVTTVCGYSYCKSCINTHWDKEEERGSYSCPQCRQTFTPRPVLETNTMLADLLEELKKTGLQAAPGDHCYAGPEDQWICYLCSVEEHKGHDTVSAAAERTERQRELGLRRQTIQQRVQDTEKDVKLLQQEEEAVNGSADKAVEDSEEIFTELIHLLEKRSSDVEQQIRSQQETEVSRVRELQERLEQEITELKRKDHELKQLSDTEDHNQLLHNYPSLSPLSGSTHSSSFRIRPLRNFEDVTAAVSQVRGRLQDILSETETKILQIVSRVDVLLREPEPETKADFLRYSQEITLDPNTAHRELLLSEGNRKVTWMTEYQSNSDHPDRFTDWWQVLSRESLTGRCYWEVELGEGVGVAVAYKNIRRVGYLDECIFGFNDKSCSLCCDGNSYIFRYNNIETPVSGPVSSRVGVYLDHSAGVLSFYSVSDTMTLLHRVQTTFTQPLYAGVGVCWSGITAEFYHRPQTTVYRPLSVDQRFTAKLLHNNSITLDHLRSSNMERINCSGDKCDEGTQTNDELAAENAALKEQVAKQAAENAALAARVTDLVKNPRIRQLTAENAASAKDTAALQKQTPRNIALFATNPAVQKTAAENAALAAENRALFVQNADLRKQIHSTASQLCEARGDLVNKEKSADTAGARQEEMEKDLEALRTLRKEKEEENFSLSADLQLQYLDKVIEENEWEGKLEDLQENYEEKPKSSLQEIEDLMNQMREAEEELSAELEEVNFLTLQNIALQELSLKTDE